MLIRMLQGNVRSVKFNILLSDKVQRFQVYLKGPNGSMKLQMGSNLFLTEMNGITISSADVKGKVMTVTEKRKGETKGRRKKKVRGV